MKRDTLTAGGEQELAFITEPDLYRLIVASKLPSAEKFERWILKRPSTGLKTCKRAAAW